MIADIDVNDLPSDKDGNKLNKEQSDSLERITSYFCKLENRNCISKSISQRFADI